MSSVESLGGGGLRIWIASFSDFPKQTNHPQAPHSDFLWMAAPHCCARVLFSLASFKVGKQGSVSWRMSLEIKLDSETNTSELAASPVTLQSSDNHCMAIWKQTRAEAPSSLARG